MQKKSVLFKKLTREIFLRRLPIKKSHVRNFSGRPSREKISREKFSRGASPETKAGFLGEKGSPLRCKKRPFHREKAHALPARKGLKRKD
jgi:hypothetical protein